jgi:hypothetical protein
MSGRVDVRFADLTPYQMLRVLTLRELLEKDEDGNFIVCTSCGQEAEMNEKHDEATLTYNYSKEEKRWVEGNEDFSGNVEIEWNCTGCGNLFRHCTCQDGINEMYDRIKEKEDLLTSTTLLKQSDVRREFDKLLGLNTHVLDQYSEIIGWMRRQQKEKSVPHTPRKEKEPSRRKEG